MPKTDSKEEGKQTELEDILDFCVELCSRMIVSGANLERVQLALERICHAYQLEGMALHLLSTFVTISAKDSEGRYASRQCAIPPSGIHLQRLKQLNRLCYTVAEQRPDPGRLAKMLAEASKVDEYPDWAILIAQMCAMASLCLIFGGGPREVIPVVLVTALLHGVMLLTAKPGLDRIVTNALTMWIATAAVILLMATGISHRGAVILITISMLVIPGIPLVNAVRNLLCGNEMNGILQVSKVTIETMALAMGIYLAIWMFGLRNDIRDVVVTPLSNPVLLIILSFLASASFGVVFRIAGHDLWRAALGGALTRVVLVVLTPFVQTRLIYVTAAALVAALYAEVWATKRKDPSTYFVYPAIIPLIPGDLFYYSLVGLYLQDRALFMSSGSNCLLTLLGMSIGFVLSSIIAHYIRKMRHRKSVKAGQPAVRTQVCGR